MGRENEELEALKTQSNLSNKTGNNSVLVEVPSKQLISKSTSIILFIITGLLSYAHKIPIISKVVKLASFWYGKTTWWKLLVLSRKIFIVANAIIGVITVLKVSGFSTDNLLAGIYCLDFTYMEMFTSPLGACS